MPFLDSELPFATPDLAGVGGVIKTVPEDFVVTEVPLYEPEGEGKHVYIDVERTGLETRTVVRMVAETLGVDSSDIGAAGRKDKISVARQWLSIPWEDKELSTIEEALAALPELTIHQIRRHQNKLKRGHNLGNQFRIRIRGVEPNSALIAEIAKRLQLQGLPNFFGPQRFGGDGLNAEIGKAVLLGRRIRSKSQRTLLLNAWQSHLFNQWLSKRLELTGLDQALVGDVARVEGRGGIFEVEDADIETNRLKDQETSLTGPMFGAKMRAATGEAGDIEKSIIDPEEISVGVLRKNRLSGSRRAARVIVKDLEWQLEDDNLDLTFFLPKGSYATVLVREFTK